MRALGHLLLCSLDQSLGPALLHGECGWIMQHINDRLVDLGNLFPAAGGSTETGTRYQSAEGYPAAGTRLLKVSAKKNELLPHGPTLSLIPPCHSAHNIFCLCLTLSLRHIHTLTQSP